jgi:hypothetical protein
MAAKFSAEQVANVVVASKRKHNESPKHDQGGKIRKTLLPLFQDSKSEFLEEGARLLQPLLEMSTCCPNKILAGSSINAAVVFRSESRVWLPAIRRRLCGRRCIRNPFSSEITRDIPYELFVVLRRVVKSVPGFVEPYCFVGSNKKGEVISFTNLHLVMELLALLSGYSEKEVSSYFKRNLTGLKAGHKVNVIANESKDFAFIYKQKQGRFSISFNFGEWNVNGYPQHS